MTARRIELLALLLVLLATACAVLPPVHTAPPAETRRVALPGEEADTLAETTGAPEAGLVPVRTHDGREAWVRETALAGASLVPGTWVLVRRDGQLVTAAVARSLDDFVEVEVAGAMHIVPIGDVLARLHHGPALAEVAPPPPPVTPAEPPPTPIGRMALLDEAPRARAALLDACSGGTAHVVYPDGSDATVAASALHPMQVHAGDHVTALWSGSPYPAVILRVRDSLVRARWDDESEQWIELSDVQSVEGTTSGALRGCPHQSVLVDEGPRVRVGRVLACEGGQATVLGPDGTPTTRALSSLARVPLRVGDGIEAMWNHSSVYAAIVLSLGDRLHVRWSDASEGDVDPADIVLFTTHDGRPAEPPSCPDV